MYSLKNKRLLVYALGIVVVMLLAVPILTSIFGKTYGYFAAYDIYLLLLVAGITGFRGKNVLATAKGKERYFLYILSFIPVGATFIIAFYPTVFHLSLREIGIVVLFSIINGTLEELFWRHTFQKNFEGDIYKAYIIPTILFTCWHFSLVLAKGVTYHGGAIALVGGACFMGILWGYVMYRTKNSIVTIIAHVLVNIFAFSQLFYQNWFVV